MENKIVSVHRLGHCYGTHWAVRDLDLDISDTGVTGLLGANGAGKSTTMNMICGVLTPTEGEICINGINLKQHPVEARKLIGFLPQKPPLYPDLTVHEYLTHCAHLHLMNPREVNRAVQRAKEKCIISHFSNRLIKSLSGGYQQRVGIAQAIVHNPRFVVLDEPTNGLDPNQIVEIRNLIREIAEEHAVLLSTHILPEIEATCQEIKMIESGRLVFSGTMEEFNDYIEPSAFTIEFVTDPGREVLQEMIREGKIEESGPCCYRIRSEQSVSLAQQLVRQCTERNLCLREIKVERCSLNEVFARLSGKVMNDEESNDGGLRPKVTINES